MAFIIILFLLTSGSLLLLWVLYQSGVWKRFKAGKILEDFMAFHSVRSYLQRYQLSKDRSKVLSCSVKKEIHIPSDLQHDIPAFCSIQYRNI